MNPIHSYRRFLAFSCPHCPYQSEEVTKELLVFKDHWAPDVTICLGDIWDTTAWRQGAIAGGEINEDIDHQFEEGRNFLRRLEPTLTFEGNHDERPKRYLEHFDARVRKAAQDCLRDIHDLIIGELKSEYVPYHIKDGWRRLGTHAVGHGYMFNEHALKAHAEMCRMPVIIGHIHKLDSMRTRQLGAPKSYAAGLIADIDALSYATKRRATTAWSNGWLFGEFNDERTLIHEQESEVKPARVGASIPKLAEEETRHATSRDYDRKTGRHLRGDRPRYGREEACPDGSTRDDDQREIIRSV